MTELQSITTAMFDQNYATGMFDERDATAMTHQNYATGMFDQSNATDYMFDQSNTTATPELLQTMPELLHDVIEILGGNVIVRNLANPHTHVHVCTYLGQAEGSCPQGVGVAVYNPHDTEGRVCYKGEYMQGVRQGLGTVIWRDGAKYEGEWQNDAPCGHGVWTYSDGGVYCGQFELGVRQGVGVYVFASGNRYFGQWAADERDGKSIEEPITTDKVFMTEYRNGAKILRQEVTQDFSSRFFAKTEAQKVGFCTLCAHVFWCACTYVRNHVCVWTGEITGVYGQEKSRGCARTYVRNHVCVWTGEITCVYGQEKSRVCMDRRNHVCVRTWTGGGFFGKRAYKIDIFCCVTPCFCGKYVNI
jgi:hypothetical protein